MSTQIKSSENILELILNALPLAFGVVILIFSVLNTLGIVETLDLNTIFTLVGISLLCLGLSGFNKTQE